MGFSDAITNWYKSNKRDLPWRNTIDPYTIWLSEIILQQTRVEQGLPYFNRFLETYPTVSDFAAASEDGILKLWQGLGYYSRGRNMLVTARLVQQLFGGKFPTAYADLIRLKGIGEYTAAAISSFAADEAKAVVDGNVYRVLARYFGIDEPINSNAGKKLFQNLADELLNREHAGLHNQAMMEFGAMLCKPKNPTCGICPVRDECIALLQNKVNQLPVKLKTVKIRKRYFNYFLIIKDDAILMRKRDTTDIWAGLYDLPLIETEALMEPQDVLSLPGVQVLFAGKPAIQHTFPVKKHVLTHQHLYVSFIQLNDEANVTEGKYLAMDVKKLKNIAMPQIIFILLTNFLNL